MELIPALAGGDDITGAALAVVDRQALDILDQGAADFGGAFHQDVRRAIAWLGAVAVDTPDILLGDV